jgi:hypothetical protein
MLSLAPRISAGRPRVPSKSRTVAVQLPIPSWVPAAGDVASYNGGGATLTNNWRATHDPGAIGYDPFDSKKINSAYSGPLWVPGWRTYGGVFFFGGGHSATNYNGAHILSLYQDTMTFECVQTPYDWTAALDRGDNLSEINTYGEATGSSPLKLGGPHSYGALVAVGSSRDKVLLPYSQAYGYVNTGQGAQALQSMDLSNPSTANTSRAWVRESSTLGTLTGMNSPSHCCYVPSQDRVYFMTRGGGNLKWVDWAAKTYNTGSNAGWGYDSSDTNGGDPQTGALVHVPERNLLLGCYRSGGNLTIQRITTTDSQPTVASVTLGSTISVAVDGAQALAWCSRSARVLLLGSTVYEIEIPSTLTDSWPVTSHTPNIAITYPALGGWGKFEYDDRLRAIVIPQAFVDTGNDVVQVYRPRNT